MAPQIISFSPGVLTIAHPGDPIYPAVLMTTPDTPFRFADDSYELKWQAFDPDGSARVRLEAGTSSLGVDYQVLAEDLDPQLGTFEWDTSELPEVDWYIRATIEDDRGLSFTTYAQYILAISHAPEQPDAGLRDAGPVSDAGVTADAGFVKGPATDGCRCIAPQQGAQAGLIPLSVMALALAIRRRRPRHR